MAGKIIDISGKKYGLWTVLHLDEERSSKSSKKFWVCECGCENHTIKSVRADHLKDGSSSSCGCERTKTIRNNIQNVIGQKFNHLTVLDQYLKNGESYCICSCDCGTSDPFETKLVSVKKGYTKSCGCLKKIQITELGKSKLIDITGNRYGHLVVIERVPSENYPATFWKCKCDCGRYKDINGQNLKRGLTTSCGLCQTNSRGEEKIANILDTNNIRYEQQKTFNTCRFEDSNMMARFDFFLPDFNILIEYDGQQHFYSRNSGWDTIESFNDRIKKDAYKTQWCLNNNITLIRIPYTHLDSIILEDLLDKSNYIIKKGE